jgi:hypothetical protein
VCTGTSVQSQPLAVSGGPDSVNSSIGIYQPNNNYGPAGGIGVSRNAALTYDTIIYSQTGLPNGSGNLVFSGIQNISTAIPANLSISSINGAAPFGGSAPIVYGQATIPVGALSITVTGLVTVAGKVYAAVVTGNIYTATYVSYISSNNADGFTISVQGAAVVPIVYNYVAFQITAP